MASLAPKHNDWAPVRMRTSKCDHCSKGSYNSSILQRCNLCGRQVCKTCMENFSAEVDHEGNVDNCDWTGEVEAKKPRTKKGASKAASDEPLRRSTRARKVPTSKDESEKLQAEKKKKPVVKKSQKGKEVNAEPATKKRKGENSTKDEPASKKLKTDENKNEPAVLPVAPEPKKQLSTAQKKKPSAAEKQPLPAVEKKHTSAVPRIIIKRKAEEQVNEEPAAKKLRIGNNTMVEPAISAPAPSPTKPSVVPRLILKHNRNKLIQQPKSKSTTSEALDAQLAPKPKKKERPVVKEASVSKADEDIAPVKKANAGKAATAKAATAKAAAEKVAAAKVAAQKATAELKAAEKVAAKKIAAEKLAAEKAAKLAKVAAAKIAKAAAKAAAAEIAVNKPATKKGKGKTKSIQKPEPEVPEEVSVQPSFIPFVFVSNPAKRVSSKFQRNGYTSKPHGVVLPSAERWTIPAETEEEEGARIAEETMLRKELAIQEARDRAEKDLELAAFRKRVEGEWKTNPIIQRYLKEGRVQDAEELFDLAMMCTEAKMEL